jgi:hypothetical protein
MEMSWYTHILGEITTSLKAKPLVMEVIGKWTHPEADGQVELTEDAGKGALTILFNDYYRNLGRFVEHEIYKIAQKFPEKTEGCFTMYSTDGDFFAAECRVEKGKLFRRGLSQEEEEVIPKEIKLMQGEPITVMVKKETLTMPRESRYTCGECGGQLQVVEAVSGCFSYPVHDDRVDWDLKEYAGDSWLHVECVDCHRQLTEYEVVDDRVVPAGGSE